MNQPSWRQPSEEHGPIRLLALWLLLEASEQAVSKGPRIGEDPVQAEGGQPAGWPPAPAPCPNPDADGHHRTQAIRELCTLMKKEIHDSATPRQTRRIAEILELLDRETMALEWWVRAARRGDKDAQDYLEILHAESEEDLPACREWKEGEYLTARSFTSLVSDLACPSIDPRATTDQVEPEPGETGLDLVEGTQALVREIESFLAHLDHTTDGPRC
ncbi:hypothetical protein [Streptomyces pactum]|uniref:hypothetical protein n=1 Tax=Streptomyces pactum TaxID=68249 RepID=UPI000A640DCC|nr:hypothetical protein [Streptomyces pactum]